MNGCYEFKEDKLVMDFGSAGRHSLDWTVDGNALILTNSVGGVIRNIIHYIDETTFIVSKKNGDVSEFSRINVSSP